MADITPISNVPAPQPSYVTTQSAPPAIRISGASLPAANSGPATGLGVDSGIPSTASAGPATGLGSDSGTPSVASAAAYAVTGLTGANPILPRLRKKADLNPSLSHFHP